MDASASAHDRIADVLEQVEARGDLERLVGLLDRFVAVGVETDYYGNPAPSPLGRLIDVLDRVTSQSDAYGNTAPSPLERLVDVTERFISWEADGYGNTAPNPIERLISSAERLSETVDQGTGSTVSTFERVAAALEAVSTNRVDQNGHQVSDSSTIIRLVGAIDRLNAVLDWMTIDQKDSGGNSIGSPLTRLTTALSRAAELRS